MSENIITRRIKVLSVYGALNSNAVCLITLKKLLLKRTNLLAWF